MYTEEPKQLVEYARERLREAILTNQLKASDSFSQVQLAREFGISRTPLREAVRLLEHEGLATVNFNRRVTVSELTPKDLDSLYATRILLESLALHTNITKMDQAFLETSRQRLLDMREFEKVHDVENWSKVHREFHLQLVLGTGARIDQQIQHYFDHSERYRRLYLGDSDRNWNKGMSDHSDLQHACETGDRFNAVRILTKHYESTAFGVLEVIDPNYSPDLMIAAKTMTKGLIFLE
ncbi:GntR family transcriptional regulator [Halomonas sp. AOP43-A1-21]|uniref:GntR family transcriptional regulator n=1 Tax=Halomonas colorata TaxID=2742615 RepID=A0ABR9FWK2_9GAMM|nr:GntR family transcriptional regulator [Halomonas colorata]MBE0463030.1 GntR family transcriptional regulator [Halomonas colorata]